MNKFDCANIFYRKNKTAAIKQLNKKDVGFQKIKEYISIYASFRNSDPCSKYVMRVKY